MVSFLKNCNEEELELKMGSVLGNLYRNSPESFDITEALMDRITKLEERMLRYETPKAD